MFLNNINDALVSHARGRPDHPALIEGDAVLTFGQLEVAVGQTASVLQESGIGAGTRAGLYMADTSELLIAFFALLRIGAIVVPMDIRWTADEVSRASSQFGIATIVCGEGSATTVIGPVVRVDAHFRVRRLATAPVTTSRTTADSPAMASLSSGTTGGTPHGPVITHQVYGSRLLCDALSQGFHMDDINLCATPLYFGAGRNITICNLLVGASVVLYPPPYDVKDLVAEVARRRVTSMFLVPTLLRRLLALADDGSPLMPSLRMLISSGASLHAEEFEEVQRRLSPNLLNVYATTEAGTISVLLPEDAKRHPGSVGRPVFLTEVEVVDQERRPRPPGQIGEIRYRGPGTPDRAMAEGGAALSGLIDGWFYPGDLGYFDRAGLLYIAGRSKDMVIRGGVNIFATEIEAVLTAFDEILDAGVVAVPSAQFGEEVAAFVVAREGITGDALARRCCEVLASYKVPSYWFFVDELPKSAIGKIDKGALRKMIPADLGPRSEHVSRKSDVGNTNPQTYSASGEQ